jgi:Tfp pilus assembly protein PilF
VTEPADGRTTLIAVSLVVIGAVVPYLTAVKGHFVIDDAPLVEHSAGLSAEGSLTAALTQPSFGPAVYRPLWRAGFAVQRELFGIDPRGYHLVSIVFHVFCSVVLYFVLLRLLRQESGRPAFLGALVFAVHPVHVEAVAWISAVCHVQATALCLLALLGYLEWQKNPRWYLLTGSVLCAACAVLFQETAVVLPILIVVTDLCRQRRPRVALWLPYLAISFSYLVLRRAVLGAALPFQLDSIESALRIPEFAVAYVKSLLVPFPQFMFLKVVPAGFIGGWSYLLASAVVVVCILLMVSRSGNRVMAIQGVLWFLISMLPPLYAAFHDEAIFALRLLYLPSIAIAIVVASAATRGSVVWRHSFASTVVLLSVAGAVATSYANGGWANDEVVYRRIIDFAPSDINAHDALALHYRDLGRTDDAVALYHRIIRLTEGTRRAEALAEIGAAYGEAGSLDSSREAYLEARAIDDRLATAWLGLGNLAFLEGRLPDAISNYSAALERDPENYEACVNLALVYRQTGDLRRALAFERRARNINRY